MILTPNHVGAVLRSLNNDKAQDLNGIPARLLTETAYQIVPSLCKLFSKSLRTCVVPWIGNLLMLFQFIKGEKRNMLRIIDLYLCFL